VNLRQIRDSDFNIAPSVHAKVCNVLKHIKHASKKSLSYQISDTHSFGFVPFFRGDVAKVMCLTYWGTVPQTDTGIQVE
jgi:hypothetical protein